MYASIMPRIIGGGKNQGIFQNNRIISASICCKITSFACSEMCGYTAETARIKRLKMSRYSNRTNTYSNK